MVAYVFIGNELGCGICLDILTCNLGYLVVDAGAPEASISTRKADVSIMLSDGLSFSLATAPDGVCRCSLCVWPGSKPRVNAVDNTQCPCSCTCKVRILQHGGFLNKVSPKP